MDKPEPGSPEWERIKQLALRANISPKLARQRLESGWSEHRAINFATPAMRLQAEREKDCFDIDSRFSTCKPGIKLGGPMPLTAGPALMARCAAQCGETSKHGLIIHKLLENKS